MKEALIACTRTPCTDTISTVSKNGWSEDCGPRPTLTVPKMLLLEQNLEHSGGWKHDIHISARCTNARRGNFY